MKTTLVFTQAQLSIINTALMEMPFRVVAPLIQEINQQIQNQFESHSDARDTPSGATIPADPYIGD